MKLLFNKITLHNFLSYAHAEIDLTDRGFCFVSGENRFKDDNSLSNGSGKSSIWSGITFALLGETIQGQTTDLKNINVEETDCWVELTFKVDSDNYIITRYHKPKSDLRIIKNGEDISGKGITESKKILADNLPDLTKDLIASIIIIGQGMPNKFSNFSPSGRKELLEKLTKSDFMIEDIKERLTNRQSEINIQLRGIEDKLLVLNTNYSNQSAALQVAEKELSQMVKPDFENLICTADKKRAELTIQINKDQLQIEDLEKQISYSNSIILASSQNKAQKITESYNKLTVDSAELQKAKAELESQIKVLDSKIQAKRNEIHLGGLELKNLNAEISKILNTPDTCPYCKQKLPHSHKPDTTAQSARVSEIMALDLQLNNEVSLIAEEKAKVNDSLNQVLSQISALNSENQARLKLLEEACIKETAEVNTKLVGLKSELSRAAVELTKVRNDYNEQDRQIAKYKLEQENWDKLANNLQIKIKQLNESIDQLSAEIKNQTSSKVEVVEHQAVLKKLDTLIKRDFRGYLLSNIINYINTKAKEFSKIVFGTDKLDFYLDGNNIEITYCNKPFAGLSGGEKTRVDLILQLALRNMLQCYLKFNTNIIVLDEVTDFLDRQSCNSIMNLLSDELNSVESVFIISHHTDELELPIDSELKIIKNECGISEVI